LLVGVVAKQATNSHQLDAPKVSTYKKKNSEKSNEAKFFRGASAAFRNMQVPVAGLGNTEHGRRPERKIQRLHFGETRENGMKATLDGSFFL
jgi:hypothetical protein